MKRYLLIGVALITLLFGCTNNKDTKEEPPNNENEENIIDNENNKPVDNSNEKSEETKQLEFFSTFPEIPNNTNELINQKAGPFSGNDVNGEDISDEVKKSIREISPLPENANDELLEGVFKYMFSLVSEDFPNPQDLINKWEFGAYGDPDLPDSRFHFKENYNIEVLLDASGSMGAYIGNKTMMQIAKESISDFMNQIPEEANVSFRVYGHVGRGTQEDKEKSCAAIEQVYGFEPYDEGKFQKELDKIEPAGWTPLAEALKQSEEALSKFDPASNTNLMYVVSDGIETCGGDPIKVAETLKNSSAEPIINIIGFNMEADERAQLEEVARVSGGIFAAANNQEQLKEEFERAEKVLEAWEQWKLDAVYDADALEAEHSFDILEIGNIWDNSKNQLANNLWQLGYFFLDEGIITSEQQDILNTKINDLEETINTSILELTEELQDINANNIEELKKGIEDKYSKQTKD